MKGKKRQNSERSCGHQWSVVFEGMDSLWNGRTYMGVSKNRGTPKSSILIGFSIINHPFWGTPIFGNIHIYIYSINIFLQFMVHESSPLKLRDLDEIYISNSKIALLPCFMAIQPTPPNVPPPEIRV